MKAQFFRTTWPFKKLSKKYLRFYKIIFHSGTLSFTLCLLKSMCFVHLVFYISMLEPSTSNAFPKRTQSTPALVIINKKFEYKISWIVNSKINQSQACKLLYKII